MRIGIDARELCGRSTGVGRYLAGLLEEWSRGARAQRHEFVLYAPESAPVPLDAHRFATRVVPGAGGSWWEQVQAPRAAAADHLDVWFAPAYSAPLSLRVPTVLAVHDISFFARPEWFAWREGLRRRWLTRRSVVRAVRIVTISQFSRRELMERLDVPEAKISVIPPGITVAAWGPGAVRSPRSPGAPRVLYVGSLFTRRHVSDLIRAFAPVARRHPAAGLDIVGDNRTYPREDIRRVIVAEGLDDRVRWHAYVSDDELREMYEEASAFAFLSEYEGLGLTPLEALAAGLPPVLLDTPVARESCGDAAVYVRVGDGRGITRALEQVLFDRDVRDRILGAAPAVLARYDWARAADETLKAIEG